MKGMTYFVIIVYGPLRPGEEHSCVPLASDHIITSTPRIRVK